MSVTEVRDHEVREQTTSTDSPGRTRESVLASVLAHGPLSAADLATRHALTPAGVRRHLDALAAAGMVREAAAPVTSRGRGRPPRRWVATPAAQAASGVAYDALALDALDALTAEAGPAAVQRFAVRRAERAAQRYSPALAAAGPVLADRVDALAQALSADGYAASLRVVGDPRLRSTRSPSEGSIQLCQGHCPVHAVAEAHPALCDAETEAFSRLLGVPLRRLATIAAGSHACTTHISTPSDHRPARQEGMDRA